MRFSSLRDCKKNKKKKGKKKFWGIFSPSFHFYFLFVYLGTRPEAPKTLEASAKTQTPRKKRKKKRKKSKFLLPFCTISASQGWFLFCFFLSTRFLLLPAEEEGARGAGGCVICVIREKEPGLPSGGFGGCRRRCEGGWGQGCGGAAIYCSSRAASKLGARSSHPAPSQALSEPDKAALQPERPPSLARSLRSENRGRTAVRNGLNYRENPSGSSGGTSRSPSRSLPRHGTTSAQ